MDSNSYRNFTVKHNDHGVCRVILDVPERPLNVLTHGVMTELEQIISGIENDDDIKLLVFSSGKESGFLAGADVEQIKRLADSGSVEEMLLRGQGLFSRIENLPMKTLAVIHGPCLGGGLELALACDYRIARDNSSTAIGLPEIKLGLIPGWGGTQRLPRLVGIKHGLKMILSGKHLSAIEAEEIGLVDRAIVPSKWRDSIQSTIHDLCQAEPYFRRDRKSGFGNWVMESNPIGRAFIFAAARKKIAENAMHYPALDAAIRSVEACFYRPCDGFEVEREEFSCLLGTPTNMNLMDLFFSRESARKVSTWSSGRLAIIHHSTVRSVGVIGAGAMGAGICQVAATRGYQVDVKEVDQQAAEDGRRRMDKLVEKYAKRKGFDLTSEKMLRDKIDVSSSWDGFEDSDLVIEAIVERMDVKKRVLSEAESRVEKNAILATNTSALSVTEMAASLTKPERFAGLHFFNPVHRMELVEVVKGGKTSDATIAQLVSFVRSLGKTPIVTKDTPGFLVNRILFPYLGESVLMVRDGYAVEAIDREIRSFGMPMGPLELLDQVGIDVALHVASTLQSILPDVTQVIDSLTPMVELGNLGAKSGIGFYSYHDGKKRILNRSRYAGNVEPSFDQDSLRQDGLSPIQRRLIYPLLRETIRCREEAVVAEPWMIDLAMVLGTGFAPHLGGPNSLIRSIGEPTVLFNLSQLATRHGLRFAPPNVSKPIPQG